MSVERFPTPPEAWAPGQPYRLLAEEAPALQWLADPDGAVVYCNPRWYEYSGQAEGQALGDGWLAALHPDDRERTRERWLRSGRTGEPFEGPVSSTRSGRGAP